MALKTYNSKDVVIIFGGQTLTGYDDGEFCTVDMAEDSWTHQVGADGEECRSKSNNNSATATLRFLQSSDANRILSESYLADKANNSGVKPMLIVDKSGTSIHATKEAYIVKPAPAAYAKEGGSREWVIRMVDAQHYVAGSNLAS